MKDVKLLNDITGQIIRYEEKLSSTKRWLEKTENLVPAHNYFAAEFELEIGGCGGYKSKGKFSLTKDEVRSALKRIISEQEAILEKYRMEFEKMQ